jgi:lipid-binding SYLF domain-containing protein
MRKIPGAGVALLMWSISAGVLAQDADDFAKTIDEFRALPAVAPFFETAYGYAVWPRIIRGGLGIGGAGGRGQVYRGGQPTGTSRLIDVKIGLQAGGQAYKQIIFFEDQRAYDEFTSGKFQFDANASAVAVTAGAQANAGTAGTQASAGAGGASNVAAGAGYYRGLQVFTMTTGGLMYQATIGGQNYSFDPIE